MHPNKALGQHFLVDPCAIQALYDIVCPSKTDYFVEIGPGRGALTHRIRQHCLHIWAVELDTRFARLLQLHDAATLTVIESDIMRYDWHRFPATFRLLGNIPYYLSSAILLRIHRHAQQIQDAHIMLQQEVADRLLAHPHTKEYGRLTVVMQNRFHIQQRLALSPKAFWPQPRVRSAIVQLTPRATALSTTESSMLADIVRHAFGQRRKKIRNSLSALFDQQDWQALGIDASLRAEELSQQDYITMVAYYQTHKKKLS